MDHRARRLTGSSRLVHGADDGEFDRQFWQTVAPAERLALVWDMVCESGAWSAASDGESRLQRSVCRIERDRR